MHISSSVRTAQGVCFEFIQHVYYLAEVFFFPRRCVVNLVIIYWVVLDIHNKDSETILPIYHHPSKIHSRDGIVRLLRHTYDSEKFASKLRVRDSKSSSNPNTIMPLFIYKIRLNPKPSRLILKVALYCHGAPMFNLNVVLTVLMSN